ncbi:MAG: hypothetical protein IJ889_00470 [Eubacterium sp.]|nr:hypothetical protein [Eubacterium sp.]MBR2247465.1 hypothetical protein [Bacilli bacterium]
MAINILQELNLGAAKASFSRDEVETLADIKKLDVAQKYPNNYDIFCKEDGCKYRLNKTSHSTMQDNLPHPTGKWRRVDSVISSNMPAPITVGDVVLYLGPTVLDHSKVKFQTGKYYRTEYTKVNKQMYAFVQNTAPDVPDTSPNPAVIWFSETSSLSEGSVLFTPVNGSIFDNKEHGIIMTSDWDGQSAISGSSYEYLDNSNNVKLGMVRNSNFDITFDSFPELTWNMFDTEAELENIKQNVIPEAISSATEDIKTEVKEDVNANLGQAKKLNDILTDGDIRLLKQGGTEKLVSSKPDATVSDSTIGFVQCDCNRNEETGEVTLNITNVKYGPFTSEEIAENAFVDESEVIVPSGGQFTIYAITCSVTNKVKDAIFHPLKDSNLYQGTISFDVMSFVSRLQQGLPLVVGFAAAAPYKDGEHSGSVDSNTYVSMYNLLEYLESSPPTFSNVPVSEIPDIKNRAVELLENETTLDLILFVMGGGDADAQLASSNVLELLNEQFVIGTEASGILNEFPTMRNEIEDSITEEFSNVKKLNDSLNEEDVDAIVSRPRELIFDVKSPYITYGNKLLTECTFVKLEFDNGKATITDSATVSDVMADLPGGIQEWLHDGCPAILFGIKQNNNYIGYRYSDTYTVNNCSFKVDHNGPFIDIDRKPENMFGISEVYFAIGNNENEQRNIIADFTACKFTNISIYAPGTEDVDGRHLFGDLIGDYEEDGDPITLRYYNKSNYTVLYGIALLTASPNIVSVTDFTAKNVIASINKRAIPMYQESGLLIDFPKMEEEVVSVKQTANKAVELALPAETKEYINKNIVDYKNLTLSGVQNYNNNNFTHFVSLGVETYDHSDANRTITPVFINYFDDTKEDYATSSTVPVFHPNKTRDTYVGIFGYLDFAQTKQELVDKLRGIVVKYDRDASYYDNINKYFFIKDVYVKIYGAEIADFINSTGWVRVDPGSDLGEVFENISDTLYAYRRYAQVIIITDGYYGDSSFQDIENFETNFNNIMQLICFENNILGSKLSKLDISALEERTAAIETKLEPLTDDVSVLSDATKSIIQKYPIKLATSSDSGFNGALKINADTYDPETTTSVSLTYYNYYDSSKSNYRNPANPETPMLVEDKFVAVPAFIDIPEVLGIPSFSSASQLKEYCKNISVRFNRNQSIKVDLANNNTNVYSGANVFIRDIYFRTYSTAQAPAQAATYNTKITNSNPIADLIDTSSSIGFIPIFVFILEVIPDPNYTVPLKNVLAQQNFGKFINSLCEISFNKVRDAEDKAQEAVENMSSVAGSVDNISESMSDYMSTKWLPTPIAFPDEALENESEPSGNSKNYDFLLYPTFVDVPHSTGSSVEGKKSRYSVKPIPESGENTTVKALYESEDSMYLLFGFFGEKLLPESLGGDYTIPETYNENTIESFNRTSKTLWYSDIYLNMQNTFSYSMIKGIRDSLVEIDVSNIFLNFNPRVIKSLYAKVTADPGNELTHSSFTDRGLNNMEDFVKIPYANIQDINTISMEDIVNMCGRPDKTKSSGNSKAVILFIAEIDKSSFPGLASLSTPAYGVSNTTSDILAIYQAMFANNSESSPIYMARSIDDSLKKTKEVAVEAARYAAATLTAAKHYDTLSDLKRIISEGESGYIVRNGETEGTSVADVYIKTTEGALIKIASGVEYEAPIS